MKNFFKKLKTIYENNKTDVVLALILFIILAGVIIFSICCPYMLHLENRTASTASAEEVTFPTEPADDTWYIITPTCTNLQIAIVGYNVTDYDAQYSAFDSEDLYACNGQLIALSFEEDCYGFTFFFNTQNIGHFVNTQTDGAYQIYCDLSLTAVDNIFTITDSYSDFTLTFDSIQYKFNEINYIQFPFYSTLESKTFVDNGITYTDNKDGTITANGTATADSVFFIYRGVQDNSYLTIQNGISYTFSGCASGGSDTTYSLYFQSTDYGQTFVSYGLSDTKTTSRTDFYCFIRIKSGTTVDNLVFKPQIQKGPTASPFVPNNYSLFLQNYKDASASAFDSGYNKGFDDGVEHGITQGIFEEQNNKKGMQDFIFAIMDAPFTIVRNIFDFDVLGFNITQLIFTILSILLIVYVIKRVKG